MLVSLGAEDHIQLDDDQLAAEYARTGRNSLFAEIYHRFGHLVLGLCLKYFRAQADAEDAAAGIFEKLQRDLKQHKIAHFRSWLYIYSRNYCLMDLRKRQSALRRELQMHDDNVVIMEFADGSHLNEKEKRMVKLERALEELNEAQQKCIRLYYYENRSYEEIAKVTGYSGNEVKSHLQNGKRNLKIKLESAPNE